MMGLNIRQQLDGVVNPALFFSGIHAAGDSLAVADSSWLKADILQIRTLSFQLSAF